MVLPKVAHRLPEVRFRRAAEDLGSGTLQLGIRYAEQHASSPHTVGCLANGEANDDVLSVEPDGGQIVNDSFASISEMMARRLCGHAVPWAGLGKDKP